MNNKLKKTALSLPAIPAWLALALSAQSVSAQSPPDAGILLRDLRPPVTTEPSQRTPSVELDAGRTQPLPSSPPFEVRAIRLSGNTMFDTATLHALVQDQEGRKLTLPELSAAAERLTRHYQSHGFPLARAIIPAQKITNGEVTIQVVEARYGEVRVHNQSKVTDSLLNATAASLQPGQPVDSASLDRALLLLSDIPGVTVNSVIRPGTQVGTSDLNIQTSHSPLPFGRISLDNYGNRYVGRGRLSASANIANPLRYGDVLSFSGVTTGQGMDYLYGSYETLLNGYGTRAGLSYSQVDYELGRNLRALDARGEAEVPSVWLSHPLMRGRDFNFNAQLRYEPKKLRDRVATAGSTNDRRLDNWVVGLSGDARDTWLTQRGGATLWSVGWTNGRVRFDDDDAEAIDLASARTRGSFWKLNLNASRLQRMSSSSSALYLALSTQLSGDNLDSGEKMVVGGPFSVRAYDVGVLSGDTGHTATLELRQELGTLLNGPLQAVAFFDTARVEFNRQPWAEELNKASLSGVGIGMNWSNGDLWRVSLSVATPVGGTPSLVSDSASTRGWLVVNMGF